MSSPHHILVFAVPALRDLRTHLLAEAPLETACFVLARPVRTPAGSYRLLAHKLLRIDPTDYDERSTTSIQLRPATVARAIDQARREGSAVVFAHSHPSSGMPSPSSRDRSGEGLLLPTLRRRLGAVPSARLIVSSDGQHAALLETDGTESPLEIVEVGSGVQVYRRCSEEAPDSDVRMDRQARVFGDAGQRRLNSMRIAIVGLGGTGSLVAQQLAHLGVGEFVLVDHDVIELSNLNRVVGARSADVGRPKVQVASEMVRSINCKAVVLACQDDICNTESARRLLDTDLFFSCTDGHGSRAVMVQVAYQYLVPGIDLGVVIRAEESGTLTHIVGRVQMVAPGLACPVCCGALDPEEVRRDLLSPLERREDPYITGTTVPQPAVISINSTVAANAVTMMLSAVVGVPFASRYQQFRFDHGTVRRVVAAARPDCPVCSSAGAFARGDTWTAPGRPAL